MKRILIAEDGKLDGERICELCTAAGYEIVLELDGIQALLRLTTEPFDLAVLDLGLPGLDGLGITRAVRASEFAPGLPIIGITASVTPRDFHELSAMLAAGMNDVFPKPWRSSTLLQALKTYLGEAVAPGSPSAPAQDS